MEFLKDMGRFLGKTICVLIAMVFICWLNLKYLNWIGEVFANWFGVTIVTGGLIGFGILWIAIVIGLSVMYARYKQKQRGVV